MRKNIYTLIISILFISFNFSINLSFAQVHQDWVARYNGTANSWDYANGIVLDNDGNIYVTGGSTETNSMSSCCTIKYNPSGIQQWKALYDYNASASAIAIDNLNNIYITGIQDSSFVTIKYNSSSVQQWVALFHQPMSGYDYACGITLDKNDNVYVVGLLNQSVGSATIKYNSNGTQQWVAISGQIQEFQTLSSIAADDTGNVFITETFLDVPSTIKYNASGVQQWVSRFDTGSHFSKLALDKFDNVYVILSNYFGNYITLKYNSSGILQWEKTYSYGNSLGLYVDNTGNLFVTGNPYTIKYNSSGVQQWVSLSPGNPRCYFITSDSIGNLYASGYSRPDTSQDYYTIKYNSSGVQQWVQTYDGPAHYVDYTTGVVVDRTGNVYVSGASMGIGSSEDFCTIKYSQPIGIKPISSDIPSHFSLSQNYPNPFNPSTKIKFDVPKLPLTKGAGGMFIQIKIYDILGREVATLVNEKLQPGTYEVEWNGSGYPSGVYFYKLVAGDFTETKKMIILK